MSRILVFSFALIAQTVVADDVHDVAPAMPIGNGSMAAFRKTGDVPDTVLIHFHGATSTVKEAFARSDWNAVLVVINFPGLSSAYSKPFVSFGTADVLCKHYRDGRLLAEFPKHDSHAEHITFVGRSASNKPGPTGTISYPWIRRGIRSGTHAASETYRHVLGQVPCRK